MKKFTFISALMFFMVGKPIILAQEKQAISPMASASPNTSIKKHTVLFKETGLLNPIQTIITDYLNSWDPISFQRCHGINIGDNNDDTYSSYLNLGYTEVYKKDQLIIKLPEISFAMKQNIRLLQIALSSNNKYFVRIIHILGDSETYHAELWDMERTVLLKTLSDVSSEHITHSAISCDGKYLLLAGFHKIIVLNTQTGKKLLELKLLHDELTYESMLLEPSHITINLIPDHIDYQKPTYKKTIKKFNMSDGSLISSEQVIIQNNAVTALKNDELTPLECIYSKNRKYIVARYKDASTAIWDTKDKKLIQRIEPHTDFKNLPGSSKQHIKEMYFLRNGALLLVRTNSQPFQVCVYKNLKLLLEEEVETSIQK
jgi:WD40 repeat protein